MRALIEGPKSGLVMTKFSLNSIVENHMKHMNTKAMKSNITHIKKHAIRIGIALFIWQGIAYVHLMSRYFDAVALRPEYTLNFNDYLYYILAYGSWAIFSLVLFECMKMVKQKFHLSALLTFFLIGLILWLPSYFIIDYAINAWLNGVPQEGIITQVISTPNALIFFYGIVYTLTFVGCICILMYKNARESQLSALKFRAQQSETQLQLLQSQLGPHFLFNCLGSISALVRKGSENELLSAVNRVGNLLRYTIESAQYKKTLLRDELVFVENYIALQTLRFGKRFEYKLSVDDALSSIQVPPFLIQPLIENAFAHAVAKTEETVQIHLTISEKDEQLLISASNTYIDIEKSQQSFGSAISNLRARLEMIFNLNFSLRHGRNGEQYECHISIPIGDTN